MNVIDLTPLALLFVAPAIATFIGTAALLPLLRARAILDHPNERSSHQTPTPKGGGIVVMSVILLGWVAVGIYLDSGSFLTWAIPGIALVLAVLSWLDDLRGLPPLVRLFVQVAAVIAALALRPEAAPVFQGLLPLPLDMIIAGLMWVWFINLFNFMDGIDGITGVETLVIGIGIGLIGVAGSSFLGLIVAGAALGFLKWNWHPAKLFLGDVGSVPLGFLLGWLLLDLAQSGHWAAAMILPGYYFGDATITLIGRALKGEKVWQAHRQHFYQQAIQRGLSHRSVAAIVLGIGIVLIALAWAAERGWQWIALAAACALCVRFLIFFRRGAGL